MDDDDEDGLEEEIDRIAMSEPKEYSKDCWNEQNGGHIDWKTAHVVLLPDQEQLRIVAGHWPDGNSDIKQPHFVLLLDILNNIVVGNIGNIINHKMINYSWWWDLELTGGSFSLVSVLFYFFFPLTLYSFL